MKKLLSLVALLLLCGHANAQSTYNYVTFTTCASGRVPFMATLPSFLCTANLAWDNTNGILTIGGPSGGVLDSLTGTNLSLLGGNGLTDATEASILVGSNGVSGAGGTLALQAGNAATTGIGGALTLNSGNGAGTNQGAGSVTIAAGSSTGSANTGTVNLATHGITRLTIFETGDWALAGTVGASGTVPTSNGTGTPPTYKSLASIIGCAANQIVYDNVSGSLTCSSNLTFDGTSVVTVGSTTTATVTAAAGASATSNSATLNLNTAAGGATSGTGGPISLKSGAGAGSSSGAGGAITIQSGAGSPNGNSITSRGGAITITVGQAGGSSGSPGAATLTLNGAAGSATAATGLGGNVIVNAGQGIGTASGNGGVITIQSGNSTVSGNGGNLNFNSGSGATNGNGGTFGFTAGSGAGTGTGGALSANAGGGGATGNGGALSFVAGPGGGTSGNGGAATLAGGTAAAGTGGNVILTPGTGSSTANGGQTIIQSPGGNNTLIIDQFGNVICTCVTTAAATDGFSYLGAVSALPTGVPAHVTGVYANSIPMRYDTADNILWAYNGAWKGMPATSTGNSPRTTLLSGFLIAASFAVSTQFGIAGFNTAQTAEQLTLVGSGTETCATPPTVRALDCGSAGGTCGSPTVIASLQMSGTTGTSVTTTTMTNANVAASHEYRFDISAGTCAVAPSIYATLTGFAQ